MVFLVSIFDILDNGPESYKTPFKKTIDIVYLNQKPSQISVEKKISKKSLLLFNE